MRVIGTDLLLSSGDLEAFVACEHAAALRLRALTEDIPRAVDNELGELLKRKGIEHERRRLEAFKATHSVVAEISDHGDLAARSAATVDAMRGGADVIYQAALVAGRWHGFADFLVKVPGETGFGPHGYEPLDTKLGCAPLPKHVLQLCVYADLIGNVQGVAPQNMALALGDGTEARFAYADFRHLYAGVKARLDDFVAAPPAQTKPVPCRHCDLCEWRDRCAAEWAEADHLSLVSAIRRDQVIKLENAGIATVAALATSVGDDAVPKMAPETLSKLRAQARLQIEGRETGRAIYEILPDRVGRGFRRLPPPDRADLFLDLEGYPLEGLEYLFGFCRRRGDGAAYKSFWAHDSDQERAAFGEVMAMIAGHLARHPTAHVYHYGHYEEAAFKRLAGGHGMGEGDLDDLLRNGKFVDLYRVVREAIRISEPSLSLKSLEVFFTKARTGEVATAADSVVHYDRWRETGEIRFLRLIERYNREDCLSTLLLRDWLLSIIPIGVPLAAATPVVPAEEVGAGITAAREQLAELENGLQSADGGPTDRGMRRVMTDLLDFHRRAAKPVSVITLFDGLSSRVFDALPGTASRAL